MLQIGRLPPRDVWLAARDGTPPTGKSAKFVAAVRDLLGKQNQEKERQQQPVPSRVPMPAGSALLQMSKTLPVAGLLGYLVQANVQAAREATHHGEQVRPTWTDLRMDVNGLQWIRWLMWLEWTCHEQHLRRSCVAGEPVCTVRRDR
jgi:hypothetical protein